ncbi:EF-Tu/IF-2/RF-3 family GTPase, partial [Treponema endosymbiont of Eucomonympha sp.]|uniref:EF-Tu/IF-2/RF-3 family GTPase n=1 Tax=Treponema endosymbiont of Eucomonympha sp. TaxID=1580831 RepID=UPI000A41D377
DIAPERLGEAQEWREKLLDEVASHSDELADMFLSGTEIPIDTLLAGIRRGTLSRAFVPFLCGAARRNQGVQPLIDAVVDFLPAPDEAPPVAGFHIKKETAVSVPCDPEGAPLGLVFKIQHDRESGSLCYVRMYSGRLKTGDQVYNAGKKKRERVSRILRMHSNKSEPLDSVSAGDIAVVVGLKHAQTGDTIGSEGFPVLLEKMRLPEPVISVSIEPATLSDRDKLKETLDILTKE